MSALAFRTRTSNLADRDRDRDHDCIASIHTHDHMHIYLIQKRVSILRLYTDVYGHQGCELWKYSTKIAGKLFEISIYVFK